jgi:hypothetical protein
MISIYIDNILLRDTPELTGLRESITLDEALNAWVVTYTDFPIDFYGDGFNYIKQKKNEVGYNYKFSIQIVINPDSGSTSGGDVLLAEIPMTDVKINHTELKATCKFINVNFEGQIKTNSEIQVSLREVAKSIDGVDISAYTPTTLGLRLFDPADGTHDGNPRYGVNLIDAIRFSIKYITNDAIDFVDNYFSTEWPTLEFCLVKGRELRLYTHDEGDKPVASFTELMQNAYKLFNVWWYIDYTTKKPKLVLDSYDNIYGSQEIVRMDYILDMNESFYQAGFFTNIEVGTKVYIQPIPLNTEYLPFINGFTHQLETFSGRNSTLINKKLDLVSDWVMDHNLIAFIFNNPGVDTWDNYMFLVECENTGALIDEAVPYTYGLTELAVERRYNENLLNYNRLSRFTLPIDVGFDTGLSNDNFTATSSTDASATGSTSIFPIPFDTIITDPGGNYDTGGYQYKVPLDGNYGFNVKIQLVISGLSPGACHTFRLRMNPRYSGGTLKPFAEKVYTFNSNSGPEGFTLTLGKNFFLLNGDTVEAVLISQPAGGACAPGSVSTTTTTYTILHEVSTFSTSYVQNEGGLVVSETSINDYFGSIIEFDTYCIPLNDWKKLKSRPILDIRVSTADERYAITKIKSIERDIVTSETDTKLITKIDLIGL